MKFTTLFIGHPIRILDRVDSTNSFAAKLIKESPPSEGYVVWAKEQYSGRGQRGANWHSEPFANLTFSIILRPHFLPIERQFQLTKAIALGIASFISHCLKDYIVVKIKWPNDIYVKNCKIAGILIENILDQSTISYSVAGIGLNVNQVAFDPSLPNPTSLKALTGKDFNPEDCLQQLCSFIEKHYLDLRSGNHQQLDEAYSNLLYRKNVESAILLNGEAIKAEITGVNPAGHLILKKKSVLNNPDSYGDETIVVKDSRQLVYL